MVTSDRLPAPLAATLSILPTTIKVSERENRHSKGNTDFVEDEQAEHVIGEWMEKRGIRDDMVIAT